MGDSPDSAVLWLLVPGILTPLFALGKTLLLFLLPESSLRSRWRRVLGVSLVESSLPLAVLCVQVPFFLTLAVFARPAVDARWFRVGFFLVLLYVGSCAVNHVLFFKHRNLKARDLAASLLLGAVPPLVLAGAWMAFGSFLLG